ncbi:hypothetical protein N9Y65_01800 [Alphaproteobacteria bacterium]|nr:hypothetical protein [Alphaproteobacteria bacterium]
MAITAGGDLNSVPSSQQQTLSSNYLDLASTANQGWAQQYLPDLMEKEAEVFGPRTISGFLSQVGAEEAMTADQVVWSEQSRLHISLIGTIDLDGNVDSSGAKGKFTVVSDIDGNIAGDGFAVASHGVRNHDIVLIATAGKVSRCMVVAVDGSAIGLRAYDEDVLTGHSETASACTLLVIGSEYKKGDNYDGLTTKGANEPTFKSFSNKPIIMKDNYTVSGSDVSRIGWVEVAAEDGSAGYLWYLKAEADTRARFNDHLEMTMLEAIPGSNSTNVDGELGYATETQAGTKGLFYEIEQRGNVTTGITGVNAATDLAEFDAILAEFDKQGAIEENMMFVNRATSLAMDDMLASMNSYGAGGTSYGVFDNSEDMALNLGFSGFRRGSYDFYKSDFRYLNDRATRGGINAAAGSDAIRGVFVPAGTSTVYDQMLGKNLKRPFLHVRYRASQTDDRRMKSWVTGSVGAATSALDAMEIHMLSERCLVTQGANNFMLMK